MKQNTYFKGNIGSCFDLLITNSKLPSMKTNSFDTGLSHYHHMKYIILKTKSEKSETKKKDLPSLQKFQY